MSWALGFSAPARYLGLKAGEVARPTYGLLQASIAGAELDPKYLVEVLPLWFRDLGPALEEETT